MQVEKGGALYFAAAVHFVSELAGDEHVRRGRETPVAPVGFHTRLTCDAAPWMVLFCFLRRAHQRVY